MKIYIKNIVKFLIPLKYKQHKLMCWIRLSHFFYKKKLKYCTLFCENIIYYKFGCEISSKAIIGKRVQIPHPLGIVIGEGVKIGNDVVIYQNVTIGRKNKNISKYPQIGNNVIIYCNSLIAGEVKIVDGSIIGANSVVITDINVKGTYVGIPARKVN